MSGLTTNSDRITRIYRNDSATANTPPQAPSDLDL
jgi:hypothetical protein